MFSYTEVGVDLGEYEIKLVTISSGEINQLEHSYSHIVESELYSDNYFKELKVALKKFSKEIKKSKLSLNITLPLNQHSVVTLIELPAVEEKALNQGVYYEAKQHLIDSNIKDYDLTWKKSEEYQDSNEYEILLSILNKKVTSKLTQFKTLKYKINKVMLQLNALEYFAKANDIIIDFGHRLTRVYMYKEGKLAKVEQINFGGINVQNEINNYTNEKNEKLEKEIINELYITNDFIEEENEHVRDISNRIKDDLMFSLDEIKRIVRSFELQEGLDIDNVYYTGGFSNFKNLPELLESVLDLDVSILNIIIKNDEDSKYDMAALSAMISTFDKNEMNFASEMKPNIDYISILIATISISLSIIMSFYFLNKEYEDKLFSQREIINQQESTLSEVNNDIYLVENVISESNDFIHLINSIQNKESHLSEIMYSLPSRTTLDVVVKSMKINNNIIELEGYSANYSSLGFFAKKLEDLGEVEITNVGNYEEGKMYSVITDRPEAISDRYIMTKTFKITIK